MLLPTRLSPRGLVRAALFCAALACAPMAAHGARFTGTFEGIATAVGLPLNFEPPRPVSYYDGAPLTGTFDIFVPDATPNQISPFEWGNFLNGNGGYFSMSVDVKDAHFDVFQGDVDPASGAFPSVFWLSSGDDWQFVQFMTDFQPKYSGGIVTLRGPRGSLFNGLDPSTLHLDPGALPTMSGYLADADASIRLTWEATAVSFQLAAPVPEPAPLLLLALGGGVLAACRGRARVTRT